MFELLLMQYLYDEYPCVFSLANVQSCAVWTTMFRRVDVFRPVVLNLPSAATL